jgi:hypothetical protein
LLPGNCAIDGGVRAHERILDVAYRVVRGRAHEHRGHAGTPALVAFFTMASDFRKPSVTPLVWSVLLAGIAGNVVISLYLSFALPVFFGRSPLLLFQWDASNIVGPVAFAGGWGSAALGLFFDFIVSWCWAAVFTLLYVTVPAIARPSSDPRSLFNAFIAHTVFFGVPVALVVAGICRRALAEPHEGIRAPAD